MTTELVDPDLTVELRQRVLRPHETQAEVAAQSAVPGSLAVAVIDEGRVVSCVLAQPEPCPDLPDLAAAWRLRGMATDPDHRGRGLGAAVLDRVLGEVARRGADGVWCNARTPARSLYERGGFQAVGEPWDDADIGPHVRMWCRVPAGPTSDRESLSERGR